MLLSDQGRLDQIIKLFAITIGFLILALVVLQKLGLIGIGVRTNGNVYVDHFANIAVTTWLYSILFLIEAILVLMLFRFRNSP